MTFDADRITQLRRLLADKIAAGDRDAIEFAAWLDAHLGRLRPE